MNRRPAYRDIVRVEGISESTRKRLGLPKSFAGWKYRAKGEFAHYFALCGAGYCVVCLDEKSHALCNPSITVGWLERGGFSPTRPKYRSCEECTNRL